MLQKNILAGITILMLILTPFAYAGRVDLTTYYPPADGRYKNLKSTGESYFVTTSGNVGIGMSSGASVKLDLAQNTAIKVGQAYLSSGGNYAHLATNEWYDGSTWIANTGGVLFQLNGATDARVYTQSGGTNTSWDYTNATTTARPSGWGVGCSQALKQNIRTLTFADYASLRGQFRATDLFSYNRKDTPTEPEVGFIAEHAPDLILDKTKTQVPLIKGIGYLAAILKAQENVLMPLEKAVQAFKHEVRAFGTQQRQIEALQKEVEGLKKEFHSLKEKNRKSLS